MDAREPKLPQWAQVELARLRKMVAEATEPLTRELTTLRPQVHLLETRLGAMEELLMAAAKGGHVSSKTVIDTLAGYGLELAKE